mmetsp:Transcript_54157/g.116975  ORF Transcript_54157/g.116975 Transcript_54157/m.116975 type:complete len:135 (-) Transcript_54157:66-470(-)|eukprot:CAMPEP_0170629170 /NCGR_PEP_ID=MMETSP0224-20130122/33169_1 /TAXON_ID=285029 /ORGANISM="Togula jolla, Strain CCCM 725" /LENGTH=134 /DNA_ID=CAMNT_0010956833 /DNA_START=55 /DNA_END=459 /DNA_ORIENTATION=-
MVRPILYAPVKPFKLSKEATDRYKAIAAEVKAKKVDPSAAIEQATKCLAELADMAAKEPEADEINEKDPEYVGVLLGGTSGSVLKGGELPAGTDDVYFEEPRVVVDDDEAEDEDELRSLWGDGEKDPAEEEEEE